MKKIKLLFLLIIISSCKQENESYAMYGLMIEEFVHSNAMLESQILNNISNDFLINDNSAQLYHSLTTQYLAYLDNVYLELIRKIESPTNYSGEISNKEFINVFFFKGEKYNEKATEFIIKLDSYRTDILKLIDNENLANRIRAELKTDYIQNREGEKIDYLNYIYKDLPLISVLSHMKYRKKVIIEFENDFLKNRMLNK